jgi:hypothetical protein
MTETTSSLGYGPRADRAIRRTTTASVALVGAIAAGVSFRHIHELALRHGESHVTSLLLPLSVDGMVLAASMSLLLDSRRGTRGGALPWLLLCIGSLASVAANVAAAEPTMIGRIIAGWPGLALVGSLEMLMRQIRLASASVPPAPGPAVVVQNATGNWGEVFDALTNVRKTVEAHPAEQQPEADVGLQSKATPLRQQAWQWAIEHKAKTGKYPTGRQLAATFNRRERWGRLVKQAGLAGYL